MFQKKKNERKKQSQINKKKKLKNHVCQFQNINVYQKIQKSTLYFNSLLCAKAFLSKCIHDSKIIIQQEPNCIK